MKFQEVKNFCLHWGFDIEDDYHNGMPFSLFNDMIRAARKAGGNDFAAFMRSNTDTTDGTTYFSSANSWKALEDKWDNKG